MKKIAFILFLSIIVQSNFAQELKKTIENAHTGQILTSALSAKGDLIVSGGSDNRASLWDAETGEKIKSFADTKEFIAVAFNSNSKLFVTSSASNKIIIWDSKAGKPKKILKGQTGAVISIVFNPINDNVAGGSSNNQVLLWDSKTGKLTATLEGHEDKVTAITYSPDGKKLASGSADNTIKIWNPENGNLVNTINAQSKGITSIMYSSDGKYLASGGMNGSVILWDVNTGKKAANFSAGKKQVNSVALSPDVQYIAFAGEDNNIIIYNIETNKEVSNIEAHDKTIISLAFSDINNVLVSSAYNGNMKIWDVSSLNIAKKKYMSGDLKPLLVCSSVTLVEDNNNGIIENSESPVISFNINNSGEGQAYNIIAKVVLTKAIKGIEFEESYQIGNLDINKTQNVEIPFSVNSELETTAGIFTISIIEANGNNPEPVTLNFQTKGVDNNIYIMVDNFEYSSPTGKAEIGAHITLKLRIRNTTGFKAPDIKVNYLFPENVMAVDRLSETINIMQANETKEISVKFYANDNFTASEMNIGLNIEGAAYTNIDDLDLSITMNEELPSGSFIAQEITKDQNLYRGDPLKGLNVSYSTTELTFGDYYALIIGIDNYKGEWSVLNNAVNDAKTIENLLKNNYKFDYFKTLYNEKATRVNIITELELLVKNVKETDNVLIYYSGHGEFKQELNKGYWVPIDALTASTSYYISNSDIQTFLGGIKSKHTLLISDACFSGDIFRGQTVTVPFEESDKYYAKVHNIDSRQAITSGGIEPVMDGGRDGHSVFAYYLLKALTNNSKTYLDASQLYENIKIPVINNSEQTPKLNPIKNTGDEGGQFIFLKK